MHVRGADPHLTLLEYLRRSGLTGAKEGCAEGECGACAVVLRERAHDGSSRYIAVNSCLLLLPMVHGREVWTVEAVARGDLLHPVQQALVEHGGSQCGYCTPGFVMSMFAEYYRPGRQGFDLEAIGGNLCRCTGYRPIRDAARSLGAPQPDDPFLALLAEPAPAPTPLAYEVDGVRFFRPANLDDALELLRRHPGARPIAGGTDLVVDAQLKGARWPVLVSLEALPELRHFSWGPDRVELGAALTLAELEERLDGRIHLLGDLFPLFASRLVRQRATLGGNVVTASPVGDGSPALLVLDAQVRVASREGERVVPLERFFTGYRKTALQPGELVVSLLLPLPLLRFGRFYKVAKRQRDDISTVAAAMALDLDEAGRVARVRLAYGGVAPTPVRAYRTEAALTGRPWTLETVREAQQVLAEEFTPIDDHRGSAAYRRAVTVNLLERFYHDVWAAREVGMDEYEGGRPRVAARERARARHRPGPLHG